MSKQQQRTRATEHAPLNMKLALTLPEAAALTGLSVSTLESAIETDNLVAHRYRRRVYILPHELTIWLAAQPIVGEEMAT